MKKVFGVPIRAISIKGSILWPLLFLIFINDMVEDLSSDPSLYADDALLIKALHSSRDVVLVNKDLQIISDWAAQWRVNFNASKTVYMIVSKKMGRPESVSMYLNGQLIERVPSYCHLGLWITEKNDLGYTCQ